MSNIPELVQLFQDWTTVALEVKNGVISTYKNGALIRSIDMGQMKLGKLAYISVVFKGTGSIDWIKATDNNGNLQIREEFNTDYKSTVEFF